MAVDRISKFAFAQVHGRATTHIAADFPPALLLALPYRTHTMITDKGQHFTPGNMASATLLIRATMVGGGTFRANAFELPGAENRTEHRLIEPDHPWTNGQVWRMKRMLKVATVQRCHYGSQDELRGHLAPFDAYNSAPRLKTLKGLTLCALICR